MASTSIVIAFFVFVALAFATRPPEPGQRLERCDTPACRGFAQLLAASVDTAKEPCDNFYRFVCGKRKSSHSVYEEQLSYFFEDLATVLRDTRALTDEQTVSGKAASLYASCESVLVGGNEDLDGFREVLRGAQLVWPMLDIAPDLLATTFRIKKHFDITSLLKITRLARAARTYSEAWQFLLEPGDIFGLTRRRNVAHANSKFYSVVVSAVAGPNASAEPPLSYNDIAGIEEDLLDAVTPLFSKKPVESPWTDIGNLSVMMPYFGEQRWRDFFANHFGASDGTVVINVTNVDYVSAYDNLTQKWNESTMVWCTSWLAVAEMAPYMSKNIALHRFIDEATVDSAPRHCLELSERILGAAVFSSFVNKTFVVEVVEDIRRATVALLAPFQDKNVKSAWLVSPSVYEVVNASEFFWMLQQVDAYQRELDASLVDRNGTDSIARNWVSAVRLRDRIVDGGAFFVRTAYLEDVYEESSYSFFSSRSSSIRLPLYASMLPIYEYGLTEGIKLGTLGVLFAQAVFMALLARIGPDNTSASNDRLRCFSGPSGNGTYSREYDRAVPLEMLEEFLERVLPSTRGSQLDLPPRFEETQTFFLSMCYLLCNPDVGGAKFERACNEAVRHSRLFSKAFNCSLGTNMNPPDKCEFF
ncbi:hypothetical protein V5799_022045 [Amblyomma americanum]|uniref:Peptidase M13 N-terminal domain-containing protein n=1 Tax=Amblyomma americanum TaxID=6943 RepID=A0AAQ4FN77_AMBAM